MSQFFVLGAFTPLATTKNGLSGPLRKPQGHSIEEVDLPFRFAERKGEGGAGRMAGGTRWGPRGVDGEPDGRIGGRHAPDPWEFPLGLLTAGEGAGLSGEPHRDVPPKVQVGAKSVGADRA